MTFFLEHDVPKTVVMCNKLMGGVDMADQLLTTYDPNVKSVKLWKKLLMNVLLRITQCFSSHRNNLQLTLGIVDL
jgi:hypothetical protein